MFIGSLGGPSVLPLPTMVQGASGQALPADIGAPGGGGGAVLSLPTVWRGPVLCCGPPRHRRWACGAVTAHQTPVAAWPRTVKQSESWALNLGFMACVLRMRPAECFLSIHPSIHPPPLGTTDSPHPRGDGHQMTVPPTPPRGGRTQVFLRRLQRLLFPIDFFLFMGQVMPPPHSRGGGVDRERGGGRLDKRGGFTIDLESAVTEYEF